jgi:hypothetical protein
MSHVLCTIIRMSENIKQSEVCFHIHGSLYYGSVFLHTCNNNSSLVAWLMVK